MANYLRWLWREDRGTARVLVVAVAVVLACATGFAAPVMRFTIRQAGPYTVTVNEGYGISGAWISEPLATVARRVFPWVLGLVAALLAMAVCLVVSGSRRDRMRRMASGGFYTQQSGEANV
jgi:hypothetical protein